MSRRITGPCARCNRHMELKGRGLCSRCYNVARDSGTLADHESRTVARRPEVLRLVRDGMSSKGIAEHLGLSHNAVLLHLQRARAAGDLMEPPSTRRATLPPSRPACLGADGDVFDNHISALPDGRERDRAVAAALAYCARCPLATREWCVATVDPHPGGWTGVAGGRLFVNGKPATVRRRAAA